jgi:hypothetical protein
VACLVGYYGGLHNIELRSIEFGHVFESGENSFDVDQSGYWFSFKRGKQRGIAEVSSFCVPRRQSDWSPTVSTSERNPVDYDPASVIDHYIGMLELDLRTTRDKISGSFFKSAHGKNGKIFRNVPMGKNLLEKIGFEFAEELVLPLPHSFTGHCWRRSCGTNASDAGVNVTTLMAHCGWNTPKTAIGYVKKSRMTSFNMAMFLSNVQRQNQDLDTILTRAKPLIGGNTGKVRPSVCSKKSKTEEKASTTVPLNTEKLGVKFASHLLAANCSKILSGTREEQDIEENNRSIVSSIVESSVVRAATNQLSSSNFESNLQVENQTGPNGCGGVDPDNGGGGGGGDVRISGPNEERVGSVAIDMAGLSDPRVSTILNNLSKHGQLQVHFHFHK